MLSKAGHEATSSQNPSQVQRAQQQSQGSVNNTSHKNITKSKHMETCEKSAGTLCVFNWAIKVKVTTLGFLTFTSGKHFEVVVV